MERTPKFRVEVKQSFVVFISVANLRLTWANSNSLESMHSSQFSGTKATADRVYIHCTLHARAGLCKKERVCPYNLCMHACIHTFMIFLLNQMYISLPIYYVYLSFPMWALIFFPGKSGTQMFIYLSTRFSRLSINKAI